MLHLVAFFSFPFLVLVSLCLALFAKVCSNLVDESHKYVHVRPGVVQRIRFARASGPRRHSGRPLS